MNNCTYNNYLWKVLFLSNATMNAWTYCHSCLWENTPYPLQSTPPTLPPKLMSGDLQPSPTWRAVDLSSTPPDTTTLSSSTHPEEKMTTRIALCRSRRRPPDGSARVLQPGIHCVCPNGTWICREVCRACPPARCRSARRLLRAGGGRELHLCWEAIVH